VSLYHTSFPTYEKEQSYIHAIMHHRMPLFMFMYKHSIITKEQLLELNDKLNKIPYAAETLA
jgi:hypothetical protein